MQPLRWLRYGRGSRDAVKFVHPMIRYRGNDRATVFLEGEIDQTTVPAVGAALATCLANRMTEIDVDLAAVGFCDASGLNVFLEVSQHLAASEGELRLHRPAPAVSRLLDLVLIRSAPFPRRQRKRTAETCRVRPPTVPTLPRGDRWLALAWAQWTPARGALVPPWQGAPRRPGSTGSRRSEGRPCGRDACGGCPGVRPRGSLRAGAGDAFGV